MKKALATNQPTLGMIFSAAIVSGFIRTVRIFIANKKSDFAVESADVAWSDSNPRMELQFKPVGSPVIVKMCVAVSLLVFTRLQRKLTTSE